MLEERNARKGFFEADQLKAVLYHLPDHLKAPAEIAYITGWRIHDELLTRNRHHLDLKAGWLRLDPGETKNGEGRMFPLTPRMREVLQEQITSTDGLQKVTGRIIPWLFHRKGNQIKYFRRSWLSACNRAGLPGKIPHDFRRTAIRNLERAGVPRSTAMRLVGHRTESTYRRYAIVDEAMLKEGGEKLAVLHTAQTLLEHAEKAAANQG